MGYLWNEGYISTSAPNGKEMKINFASRLAKKMQDIVMSNNTLKLSEIDGVYQGSKEMS